MKYKKIWMMTVTCAAVLALSVPAFAEGADVSAVIQDTWTAAATQTQGREKSHTEHRYAALVS